jgi:hypothetical protein
MRRAGIRLAVAVVLTTSVMTHAAVQTWIDLMGAEPRAAEAIQGNGAPSYAWQGSALTASTATVYFNLISPAAWVRWVLVWNPGGNAANGVRLIHADDGPANIVPLAEVTGSVYVTPIVSAVALTPAWNGLIGGAYKHVGMQMKGAPTVFQSRLEVVY